MSQLLTLFWLRYTIFKNSLAGRKDAARTITNALVTALLLLSSLAIGASLYFGMLHVEQLREPAVKGGMTTVTATLLFLMLVSQSTGTSAHFDPRRFTLFPVRLTKLYLLNLISAFGEISLIAVLPSVAGVLVGLSHALGHPLAGLVALAAAVLWINALFVLGSLLIAWLLAGRKRKSEIVFALVIGVFGVGGQVLPRFFLNGEGQSALRWLRPYLSFLSELMSWTPVGVWSYFFDQLGGGAHALAYARLISVSAVWTGFAWAGGYAVFKMLATSARASASAASANAPEETRAAIHNNLLALKLPFCSGQTSALFAKEVRYLARNTATYLTILSALIFPLVLFRSPQRPYGAGRFSWADGLWGVLWIGYVFALNLHFFASVFAFDAAGFRQYLLAPLDWRRLLVAKNLAVWLLLAFEIALILAGVYLLDGRLKPERVFFVACSTLIALAVYSTVGNFLSIFFPYRVNYGIPAKRSGEKWSGVNFLAQIGLLVGVAALMAAPTGVGFLLKSPPAQYLSFALLVVVTWAAYAALIGWQGRLLEARRYEVAEALTRKSEKV
jgi:hypothetical protein